MFYTNSNVLPRNHTQHAMLNAFSLELHIKNREASIQVSAKHLFRVPPALPVSLVHDILELLKGYVPILPIELRLRF